MLMLELCKWWYGPGWGEAAEGAKKRLLTLADMFSIAILLRTLFAPWKRIISYPGAGLDAHLRAMLDNLVSRIIGFFVRVTVLFSAAVAFVIFGFISLAQVLLWPLVPIAAVVLIIWGLI
jgi:hypothetical protein